MSGATTATGEPTIREWQQELEIKSLKDQLSQRDGVISDLRKDKAELNSMIQMMNGVNKGIVEDRD